jgi:hypothetical protein
MKQMYGIEKNSNYFSFDIKNNSEQEKKAIIFGSLINLNGELDDYDIEIKMLESSHTFIKRDLLGSCVQINGIKIYCDNTFEYFDKKIRICKKSSAGMLLEKIYLIDCKKEDKKYIDNKKFNLKLNGNTHMEINIPAKHELNFTFIAEIEDLIK